MPTEITVLGWQETPVPVAAAAAMEYVNDGKTILMIQNDSGGDVVVTHLEQQVCNHGHPLQDAADTLADAGLAYWPVWRGHQLHRFNDRTTGSHKVQITFDVTASVQVYAYTNARA